MGIIYHYTSGPSLIGLITKGEFWATDINFLNDHAEHICGYEAALELVGKLKDSADGVYGEQLKSFYSVLLNTIKPNTVDRDTYVVSFAKEKDSISHWFSYCEKNQGYCIGFDEHAFFEQDHVHSLSENFSHKFNDVVYHLEKMESYLGRCLSHESVIGRIKAAIKMALAPAKGGGVILKEVQFGLSQMEFLQEIYDDLIYSTSSFKFEGFKHEIERRLTLSAKVGSFHESYNKKDTGLRFRERNGVIIPYVPMKFSIESIREIMIGPCNDFELKKIGLEKLIGKHGMKCEITRSKTPLRFS